MQPKKALKEMERILQKMIALNENIRKKNYKQMRLHRVPKKNIKVPYDFYLN